MDVTKSNFAEILPKFNQCLQECDFIAIDCEFTGLFTTISNDYLATHEQYYSKLRNNINKFQLIQLGISIFKKITNEEFDCDVYNFYIFPNKCSLLPRDEVERYFLCQSSSLKFLLDYNFDFNKLIKEGISYVNLAQMKYIKEKVTEKKVNPIVVDSEENKKFLADVAYLINNFMISKDEELTLPQYNSFQRKLVYDWISNSSFSERIDAITTDFKIVLKKCTQEMKEERNKTILLENIGITYIIECLIQCPKPIVGHNICLDLLYIYNAFIAPLPAQYSEFKMSFHTLFPIIFDTKYIASAEILKNFIPNTWLNKLHEVVLKEPFLTTKINLKQEFSGTNYHQAGYDSYLTGVCFINLIRYIYAREFTEIPDMFSNDILTQYRNKISVYRVYDIKFFNLESNDILSSRSNVFHMSFPKHWKRNDFNLIFEEFGGLTNVVFLDDENAFCILKEADNAGKVVESLIVNRKPSFPFKVKAYADFVKEQDKGDSIQSNETARTTKQKLESETSNSSKKIRKEATNSEIVVEKKLHCSSGQLFEDENNWS